MIHSSAIIHPKAQVDPTVEVGPYVVIDEHVVMGPGCVVGPHVYITGHTQIGANNRFHASCVIGDAPQDLSYRGAPTRLRIGDGNTFREHFTIHRGSKIEEDTIVGSNGLFMSGSHVAHDCVIGNNVILANGVLVGGHVTIGDRAFLSGNCLVHQFCRIGTLALMQGGSAISRDLPPFTIARGGNGICGLNIIGLRRANYTAEQRLELKALYHDLFRTRGKFQELLAAARKSYKSEPARLMIDFVANSKRGICRNLGSLRKGELDAESGADEVAIPH